MIHEIRREPCAPKLVPWHQLDMQTVWVAGRYSSPLSSAGKRFAATLGELTGGRVGLTAGSLGVLKVRLDGSHASFLRVDVCVCMGGEGGGRGGEGAERGSNHLLPVMI